MNLLLVGHKGQLGSTFRDVSTSYDHNIILSAPVYYPSESAFSGEKIDVIVNCAGYTNVDGAENDNSSALLGNFGVAIALSELAKKHDALLIHISTDYIFDGKQNRPYVETDTPAPLNIYGETKLSGEKAIIESGCKYMIFRTSWMYSNHGKNFFLTIADKAAESPSLRVVIDQIGTPTYARDLAEAIFHIIDSGQTDKTGIYNYSNEGVCSWYDFAKAINKGLGYTCDIQPCLTKDFTSVAVRPAYSVLDKTLFKKTFGLDVPHWEDSLEVCIGEFMAGEE